MQPRLERLAEVDTVVFDKTGTLTMGEPEALDFAQATPGDQVIAAALAAGSAHPLSRALDRAARALGVTPARLTDLREVPGAGFRRGWAARLCALAGPTGAVRGTTA